MPVTSATINVSSKFTDPGTLDSHTAVWNWGDGTTSVGTVTEANGSGSVTDSHTYTKAGVYTVTLTVTDDDGGSDQSLFQYVVVYDPNGGFVTGGGWIDSPAGAYVADPAMTGKANFGFVSKYQKGATVPTGDTEFQFKAGNLNFKSRNYEWLVISGGSRAQYKGSGTINGGGDYGFLLTATDGQASGGGGNDKFRIKIWNKATGAVVYDNQPLAGDDATPTTALQGGSIVIHSKLQALGGATVGGTNSGQLSDASLQTIVSEAAAQWAKTGLSPESLDALGNVQVLVTDLPDDVLAVEGGGIIWIDQDAAGYGWFIDATPGDDSEFAPGADSPAKGRMDLLSAVMHEMGHLLGYGHDDGDDLMGESLAVGVRHGIGEDHHAEADSVDALASEIVADSASTAASTALLVNETVVEGATQAASYGPTQTVAVVLDAGAEEGSTRANRPSLGRKSLVALAKRTARRDRVHRIVARLLENNQGVSSVHDLALQLVQFKGRGLGHGEQS
jgi:PKD repeat protein